MLGLIGWIGWIGLLGSAGITERLVGLFFGIFGVMVILVGLFLARDCFQDRDLGSIVLAITVGASTILLGTLLVVAGVDLATGKDNSQLPCATYRYSHAYNPTTKTAVPVRTCVQQWETVPEGEPTQ